MAEIDVFQNGGSSVGDNQPYNVVLKFVKFPLTNGDNENYLLMRLNKPLAQGHYAVLMRYKNRGRNGYWYDNNDEDQSVRPYLNKWFAYHHTLNKFHANYQDGSIVRAHILNEAHRIPASEGFYDYQLYGVDEEGIEYYNACTAIVKRFFKLNESGDERIFNLTYKKVMNMSFDNGVSWGNKHDWMAASFSNGIAIVDEHGTVLSNVVPLKVLARIAHFEPEQGFIRADITDDDELANLMMLYPNFKTPFT